MIRIRNCPKSVFGIPSTAPNIWHIVCFFRSVVWHCNRSVAGGGSGVVIAAVNIVIIIINIIRVVVVAVVVVDTVAVTRTQQNILLFCGQIKTLSHTHAQARRTEPAPWQTQWVPQSHFPMTNDDHNDDGFEIVSALTPTMMLVIPFVE